MPCSIVTNNELLINESHNNNFIFILERVPSSFLISQFSDADFANLDGTLSSVGDAGVDAIREANQDTQNLALYLNSFSLPDLNLGTSPISTAWSDLNPINGKLEYGTLNMNIMNDEYWFIYRMLYYWMLAGSNPEQFSTMTGKEHAASYYMRGHLILLDNHRDKTFELEFRDLHIQNMGQQELNYQEAEKIILPTTWVFSSFVPTDDYVIKKV